MALILNGTTGITVTDGSNILQDGTVTTDDLAAGAVTSAKMATGAAATNLGNYVQSFNGLTGAVTGVSTVNGSTGAVTVQATLVSGSNIKTVNGASILGSGDITAGTGNMSYDTNTNPDATTYTLGTYVLAKEATIGINSNVTSGWLRRVSGQSIFSITNGSAVAELVGTWRGRGGEYYYNVHAQLLQRVA